MEEIKKPEIEEYKKRMCKGPCRRILPLDAFPVQKECKEGRAGTCKECTYKRAKNKTMAKRSEIQRATSDKIVDCPGRFDDKPIKINAMVVPLEVEPPIMAKMEKPQLRPPQFILSIDMTDYPHIYEMILSMANTEFRTPEMQCLFWLNQRIPYQNQNPEA